jgi:hypothetical protein
MGPLLAGLSVAALRGAFPATDGYQAMWLPVVLATLLSIIPLRSIARAEDER